MSVRGQIKSVRILLDETRGAPITPDHAQGLAERVHELNARIEQQPQFSAVRPATIALHNLIVSLRRGEVELDDELVAAIEALDELADDDTFGIDSDDVRKQIESALRKRGVHGCVVCKHTELTIEPVYILMKPFPSDPALVPSQLPCAIVVCKRCGLMWMHDLAVLGVL
jgi:hypothetical protein